jgi:hypothetical protein
MICSLLFDLDEFVLQKTHRMFTSKSPWRIGEKKDLLKSSGTFKRSKRAAIQHTSLRGNLFGCCSLYARLRQPGAPSFTSFQRRVGGQEPYASE